jgi:hypothetical protein
MDRVRLKRPCFLETCEPSSARIFCCMSVTTPPHIIAMEPAVHPGQGLKTLPVLSNGNERRLMQLCEYPVITAAWLQGRHTAATLSLLGESAQQIESLNIISSGSSCLSQHDVCAPCHLGEQWTREIGERILEIRVWLVARLQSNRVR